MNRVAADLFMCKFFSSCYSYFAPESSSSDIRCSVCVWLCVLCSGDAFHGGFALKGADGARGGQHVPQGEDTQSYVVDDPFLFDSLLMCVCVCVCVCLCLGVCVCVCPQLIGEFTLMRDEAYCQLLKQLNGNTSSKPWVC